MQIQHFPQTRIYTLRASFNAMRQVIKFGFPYKLEIIGLAYESAPNADLDEEWYITSDNPHILYSRRFIEENYEKC